MDAVRKRTSSFPKKEKYSGVFIPENRNISFTREWSGYRFTDSECEALLKGESITFEAHTKKGMLYRVSGELKKQTYNDHTFWGFSKNTESIPKEWSGHIFTDEEYQVLQEGGTIYIQDAICKKNGKQYCCILSFSEVDGKKMLVPTFG